LIEMLGTRELESERGLSEAIDVLRRGGDRSLRGASPTEEGLRQR